MNKDKKKINKNMEARKGVKLWNSLNRTKMRD
jgi:hypothetical protein